MTTPYRDPEQPPACERCAARDKRVADVRRVAARAVEIVAIGALQNAMFVHTITVSAALRVSDYARAGIVLVTAFVLAAVGSRTFADNTRRLLFAAWAIAVSLAWAVFVGRLP